MCVSRGVMGISQAGKHMNETLFINEGSKRAFVYRMDMNLTPGEWAAGVRASSGSHHAVSQSV